MCFCTTAIALSGLGQRHYITKLHSLTLNEATIYSLLGFANQTFHKYMYTTVKVIVPLLIFRIAMQAMKIILLLPAALVLAPC